MTKDETKQALGTMADVLDTLDDVPEGNRHIVVLDRGWIFVGNLESDDAGTYTLTSCKNVRRWHSGGFGGVTRDPHGSGAVLDECAPVTFECSAVIFTVPVGEEWGRDE